MAELTSLKNIGRELSKKLSTAGITSSEMLREAGAKEAFVKIKKLYPNVCLVHLHCLQAALDNVELKELTEQAKKELKEFNEGLKRA